MDDEMTLYCICRSPDISRFMIMCDNCEEWYHGDCINITEDDSRRIKYFYCKPCRRKDPFLKIKYRKSRKHSKEAEKKEKRNKKNRHEKQEENGKRRRTSIKQENEDWEPPSKIEKKQEMKIPRKKSQDKRQTEKKSMAAKKDPDPSFDKESYKMESISEEMIPQKMEKDPELMKDELKQAGKHERKHKKSKCGKCENCLRKENCGECEVCLKRAKYGKNWTSEKRCRKRQCVLRVKSSSKDQLSDPKVRQPLKDKHRKMSKSDVASALNGRAESASEKVDIALLLSENKFDLDKLPRDPFGNPQCFGPGCTRSARRKSKYCSDKCGEALAAKRLLHIMPSRVHSWNSTPTVANEIGSKELERIRASMVQARSELQALEDKFRRLESIISRAKSFPIRENSDDDDADEVDHSVFCVVCGHPISLRSAIKHMVRCYIKIESQISFGSVYPTRIEGSERLFCDVYNRQQQTYCKRLKILCPEHTKEPKIPVTEVCGCPLRNDIYTGKEPSGPHDFCNKAKRKCNAHYKWESMYRACVDLQRIRQWLKIDEIFEEERRIRNAMVSRAGVIPLLLHQTTVHDNSCVDMRTKPSDVKKPAYRLVI